MNDLRYFTQEMLLQVAHQTYMRHLELVKIAVVRLGRA